METKSIFTLSQVCNSIKKTIETRYKSSYWIKAEMNKLNYYPQSGHCYPDLLEKKDGKIIAEMRSILWKDDYQRINKQFIKSLQEPLKEGSTFLFQASVEYDSKYGLSLKITDIDPTFSLGELEKEKLACIAQLKEENLYFSNKAQILPLLPRRIAIISVDTSKGYSDFISTLKGNSFGYYYNLRLFPALLQGEKAVSSIITQLQKIQEKIEEFDVVVIIRGGGGEVGLSCYNHYDLCKTIACFPLPVLSGIGHSTNTMVAEMICFYHAITPTDLGNYLIQKYHEVAVPINNAIESIKTISKQIIESEKKELHYLGYQLKNQAISNLQQKNQSLKFSQTLIKSKLLGYFISKKENLKLKEKEIALLDPKRIMNLGYSITFLNGKPIKNTENLKNGDIIETYYAQGKSNSTITKTTKS